MKISFKTISQLSDQWALVESSFRSKGYALLQGPDVESETLSKVAHLFGMAQKHLRNPQTGITSVIGESCQNQKSQVASNQEFFPHTDGTYLNGILRSKEGKNFRIGPPKIILLQCVQPASDGGGTSILVDGEKVLHTLIKKEPNLLPSIFSPVSFIRGDHLALDMPIFKRVANDFYAIRFSYDSNLYFPKKMAEPLAHFNQHYILHPQNRSFEHLKQGEILAIDNLRTLHARTAFVGERTLRRLWIYNDAESEEFMNVRSDIHYESDLPADSPTTKYESYGPIPNPSFKSRFIQTGIHIPPPFKTYFKIGKKCPVV